MDRLLRTLSVALAATAVAASPARAQSTLTFETPGLGPYINAVPSQNGLDFNGFRLLNTMWWTANYPGSGWSATSGTDVIWGAGSMSITSGSTFFLNYLYFGSGWTSNLPITVKGRRNGADLWTQTLYGGLNGPQKFELGAGLTGMALDELTFESESELYLDDLTTSPAAVGARSLANVTATPEPFTLTLLASGLAGMGGAGALRRRRRQPS